MATPQLSSVIIDVRLGECLALSDVVTVELVQKSGQLARLRVTAPREVKIEKRPVVAPKACQAWQPAVQAEWISRTL